MQRVFLALSLVLFPLISVAQQVPLKSTTGRLAAASPAPVASHPLPRRMMYFFFLRRLNYYATNPTAISATDPNAIESFFQSQIGLDDAEYSTVKQSASACVTQVASQDMEAQTLIDSIHAQTPGGRLAPGQVAPKLPPELLNMQANRNALMDSCITNLQAGISASSFAKVDAFVSTTFGGLAYQIHANADASHKGAY